MGSDGDGNVVGDFLRDRSIYFCWGMLGKFVLRKW